MLGFTLASRKKEMVDALCELIKIRSVKAEPQTNMPYGKGMFDVLFKMMSLAEHNYFDSVNLFARMGYVEYGEGDEVFAIMTHLDVVPEGEGWTLPPFTGTVKDGKVYGRGALDNKGPAIAALFALSAIQENCITLNKRVRLMFGCDEESGWADMDFYKESGGEIPTMAISPDASFPIINAEKGLMHLELKKQKGDMAKDGLRILKINGGDRVNVVPAFCECVLSAEKEDIRELVNLFNQDVAVRIEMWQREDGLHLITRGRSAHGSRPEEGRNAVSHMVAFLNTLPLKDDYLSAAIYQLGQYIGLEADGNALGIKCADESGALTLNFGYIKTEEGGIRAGLDIRYPVHTEKAFVLGGAADKLTEFETSVVHALDAHFVPEDSELVQGLKQAYEEVTGEEASCLSMGGATYARAFPNAVAFGPLFPGQEGTEHQPDEYIEIESLIKLADIIANSIMILCGGNEAN